MSKSLPKNNFLKGILQPWPAECDIHDIIVLGEIPKELNGTFYRNGPNPQYVYSEKYHMFEGDGMIHALSLANGQASYQNRWIRTEKFLAERHARKALFGGMRDLMACDDSVKQISRNTANTNVIWHHDNLLALNEGSPPVKLDRSDLRKCETYTFSQSLNRSMMAHPKIDPLSGELIFYSYFGPDFRYFIANKKGEITHQETLAMPFLSLMHDFAITEHFNIFPLFPLTWDFQRVMQGEQIFKWEANLNTRFAVMPRYGNSNDVIWFEDEAAMGFHVVNAYEVPDKIILEMVIMDDIPKETIAFADDSAVYLNCLTRWIFDLKKKTIIKERLDDSNVEFPRIDERFTGNHYRHAYLNCAIEKKELNHFDSIVHWDLKTNHKQIHNFGEGAFPLEPIFVPRSSNAAEGDGFLLSYVYREAIDRSDLVILDAQQVDDEPLAIIQLPHRVPFGFHGWVKSIFCCKFPFIRSTVLAC
ncbi:MAG: carotenoid oxygenase family protein [Tatlockia sp.]|nr:carotenoid oxygenase family protein [Tatlockia sp.]